jgi:Txe/YoeB family toxin of Txe-Axe toxin-antitoxin module
MGGFLRGFGQKVMKRKISALLKKLKRQALSFGPDPENLRSSASQVKTDSSLRAGSPWIRAV